MTWGSAEFRHLAVPIMRSAAFQRLRQTTFLGILSPRFRTLDGFPIRYRADVGDSDDKTRADHSMAVAQLMGRLASKLQLSRLAIDYAVVWGLLHDIATWPLSHTGEAGFSHLTKTDSRFLREMIVKGSDGLPNSLSMHSLIKDASLDHGTLIALFDKNEKGFAQDLTTVHKIIHSAITPDTLEGMHRSGRVFGVSVPNPRLFVDALERDLVSGVCLKQRQSKLAFSFWRSKSKIYSDFINTPKTIEFESMWSQAIQNSFSRISLVDSLELSEGDVIRNSGGIAFFRPKETLRYKDPLRYLIADDYKRRRSFDERMPLDALSAFFVKNRQ